MSKKSNNFEKYALNNDFENSKNKSKKKRIRLNFNAIFALNILLFVFALTQALCLLMLSIEVKQETINYKENGNIDYKIYLKENDFYESDFLEKDMVYVSSLIKNINATFNYSFDVDKKSNIDYEYEIVGQIIIADSSKENIFFKKEYVLIEPTKESIKDSTDYNINKNIMIDYDYYNSLANKFKQNYGVSSKSEFVVTLKVKYNNDDDNLKIAKHNELSLTIPLSENEVNIALDSSKLNNENKQILGQTHLMIASSRKLVASIILGLISLGLFVYIALTLFELKPKKNKYDAFIHKTLKEYDRLIVNTTTAPTLFDTKVIDVDSFQELLDVRDNLSIPIMYYVEEEHKRCIFYLNHDNEVFMLKVKANDLENNNK